LLLFIIIFLSANCFGLLLKYFIFFKLIVLIKQFIAIFLPKVVELPH